MSVWHRRFAVFPQGFIDSAACAVKVANAGGLYGGPKIVQLHGVLERTHAAPVHFKAQRESFLHFGLPRSTCNMVGRVTYGLGGDIAQWLLNPVDGAKLGEL